MRAASGGFYSSKDFASVPDAGNFVNGSCIIDLFELGSRSPRGSQSGPFKEAVGVFISL